MGWILCSIGMAIGMQHAFSILGSAGVGDPKALSKDIGEVLQSCGIGFGMSLIGLVLICISLFALRYRAKWFFYFCVIYGFGLFLVFPLGTVFGLVFVIFCLTRKPEFLHNTTAERVAAANP